MFDKENSFEVVVKDDPEDVTLGDVLLSIFPQSLSHEDIQTVEWARQVSSWEISAAMGRGETGISILDVYETPDRNWLLAQGEDCPLRFFPTDDFDLLDEKNADILEKFTHHCEMAFEYLFHRSLCGKYVSSVHNVIDIYTKINPKADRRWTNARKKYVDFIAPAAFWIFDDDYLSARLFCRTATIENLINLSSPDGFCLDDTDEMILPLTLRNDILRWLDCVPHIRGEDGSFVVSRKAQEFQSVINNGLKTLSALTIL